MTNHPNRKPKIVRYAVLTPQGYERNFASKREALKAAKDYQRDGWMARVRDMVTNETIYSA